MRREAERGSARSGAIDAVRVAGVLAVVAGHTLGGPLVRPLLYTWHVPLFFILAGYFWSTERPVSVELRKRTRTLMLPYAAWFALIAVPFLTLDPLLESTAPQRLLLPFQDGQQSAMPYTTFWFVSVLFVCCLAMRVLWTMPHYAVWTVAALGAAAGYAFGTQLAQTPLSIGSALPCLIFLQLGWAARRAHDRLVTMRRLGLLVLAALAATGVCANAVALGGSAPADIKQGDYGTPVVSTITALVFALTLVLTAEWVFARLPSGASAFATMLAKGGFMVVLAHPLVLWLLQHFAPPVPDPAAFVVCTVLPWAGALLVLNTPLATWLTGAPRLPWRRLAGASG